MHKRVFIIAGEPSGDYIGSKLIKDLRELTNNGIETYGICGDLMAGAGMKEFLHMNEISFIGIAEVIPHLLKIRKLISRTASEIVKYRPDAVVTIDSSGFTHRVAKRVKRINKDIPIIHYVAPPVWAWRAWRARSMHKFLDLLLTLFPFEPKYFEKFGLKSVFVGHPIVKEPYLDVPTPDEKQRFKEKYRMLNSHINICFLPGSRDSEIEKHINVFNDVMRILTEKYELINVIVPTLPSKFALVKSKLGNFQYSIVTDKREKGLAMYLSNIAVAASGSVNLELAVAGVPSVVIYKTSSLTAFIVRRLIKIKMVSIVNILLKEYVIPELLQENCTPDNIAASIEEMISSRESIVQKDAYKQVVDMIKEPGDMYAAKEVLNLICERSGKC